MVRRLPRLLSALASAVSLALCPSAAVLWVWSYQASDRVRWGVPAPGRPGEEFVFHDVVWLHTGRGGLAVEHRRLGLRRSPAGGLYHELADVHLWEDAGLSFSRERPPQHPAEWHPEVTAPGSPLRRAGFYLHSDSAEREYDSYHVRVAGLPLWSLVVLLAIPPGAWLYGAFRQRRRLRRGLCQRCGYDLRASAERCSECGTPIPAMHAGEMRPRKP